MRRSMSLIALCSVLALVASSCGKTKDTGFPPVPSDSPSAEQSLPPGSVEIIDSNYKPVEIEVKKGDEVTWITGSSVAAPHSITFDKVPFDEPSGCMTDPANKCLKPGQQVKFTADLAPGRYHYYCVIHGSKGLDSGMYGYVVVS